MFDSPLGKPFGFSNTINPFVSWMILSILVWRGSGSILCIISQIDKSTDRSVGSRWKLLSALPGWRSFDKTSEVSLFCNFFDRCSSKERKSILEVSR